jgi:hypothetical protein
MSKDMLRTMIGRQRNGYGLAMGDIQLANGDTVDKQMRLLVAEGFKLRGYGSGGPNSNVMASANIHEFWAWFTPGFFSVDFEARIRADLAIEKEGKTDTIVVEGHGKNSGQVASNANWQLAYSRAYVDFLTNLEAALARLGL